MFDIFTVVNQLITYN